MRPTYRGTGVLVASLAMGFATVLLASPALGIVAVAGVLAVTTAVAVLIVTPRENSHISLEVPAVHRGDTVAVRYRLPAPRALLRAELELGIAGQDALMAAGPARRVGADPRAWATPLRAIRHGVVTIGPPTLVQTDPFALCRRRTIAGTTGRLLVRPAQVPVIHLWTHQRRQAGALGRGVRAEAGEFDTLGTYQLGDDVRLIHWPNSARTGEVLVRRFVETPAPELVLLHDTAASAYATAEDFERAVDFSASIVAAAVAHGAKLWLCTTTGDRVWSWSGESKPNRDVAGVFAEILLTAGDRPGLRPPVRAVMATAATCTVVSGERTAALLGPLSASGIPRRITMVCLGPQGPDETVRSWAQARMATLIEAPDARLAAAQWSTAATAQ